MILNRLAACLTFLLREELGIRNIIFRVFKFCISLGVSPV